MAGTVPVGGVAPGAVRSMTPMSTADIDATPQQIAELTAAGCRIVRVAVPSADNGVRALIHGFPGDARGPRICSQNLEDERS